MANVAVLMLIGILCFFLMVCGAYMIATRHVHCDRSRVFFGVFALMSSYAMLQKMYFIFQEVDMLHYYYVLPLRELFFGQICRYLFTLYPVEVARPNWLTFRRMAVIVTPWAAYMAVYVALFGFQATPLHNFDDLVLNIHRPDVIMRVGMLLFMLPMEFVWTFVYDPQQSSAGRAWLRRMTAMVTIIAVAFVGNMLTRGAEWRLVHAIVYLAYSLYVMYVEMFVRIPVPQPHRGFVGDLPSPVAEPTALPDEPLPVAESGGTDVAPGSDADALLTRLREAMERDEMWRKPDLMLDDLARHVGSNRTYINVAIKRMGYAGFKDYLNRLRVDEIRRRLVEPGHENIQSLFFDAGYRSRTSAWRNFSAIVGCSPTEFEERLPRR